jgi:ribosomal protein L32
MIPQNLPCTANELLALTPRPVAHLRAQLQRKRLGLVFGSGASKDLGFPDWKALVRKIASHKQVRASHLLGKFIAPASAPNARPIEQRSLSSITQMLFGVFRANTIKRKRLSEPLSFLSEQQIRTSWMAIIHSTLYKKVPSATREKRIFKHPYLSSFLEIIKKAPMTVNYNFDDTLEKLLMFSRSPEEKVTTRGYETTYKPNSQFKNESGVIYHPNGFLPSTFEEGASPDLIFSDESFRDQLISATSGQYLQLTNFIFQNTCLLIGLSLEDATLQHMLRQSAVSNPGHVHYLIHYVKDDASYDRAACAAMFEANFSCYNLYTLFLNSDGIRALADLIALSEEAFEMEYAGAYRKFIYYIIGAVGVGKSTAISNFRNLYTHDEWIDERRPDMAVPEQRFSKSRKKRQVPEINRWTAEQFRKKNLSLSKSRSGIHLSDRCPLDPLTFGNRNERKSKAAHLFGVITDGNKHSIEKGHVIYLDGNADEIQQRGTYKHKHWTVSEIEDLVAKIEEVYGNVRKTVVCTRGRSATQVTKELAKVIFLDDYVEISIEDQLTGMSRGTKR